MGSWNILFGSVLIILSFGLSVSENRRCGNNQYFDPVMKKCHPCQPLCQGQTLHTECPQYCPEMYADIQAKVEMPQSESQKNTLDKDSAAEIAKDAGKGARETQDDEDPDDNNPGVKTNQNAPIGMLIAAMVFSFVTTFIIISVLGAWYVSKKSRQQGNAGHPADDVETAQPPKDPGVYPPAGDEKLDSQVPLLPDGQSHPYVPPDQVETSLKTVVTPHSERPTPLGHGNSVGLSLETLSLQRSCLAGHVITQPQEDYTRSTRHPHMADCSLFRAKGYPLQTEV